MMQDMSTTTKFKFEHLGLIDHWCCEATADDGSKARILCEFPGEPWMELRQRTLPIRNAPRITNRAEFESFCRERFS